MTNPDDDYNTNPVPLLELGCLFLFCIPLNNDDDDDKVGTDVRLLKVERMQCMCWRTKTMEKTPFFFLSHSFLTFLITMRTDLNY